MPKRVLLSVKPQFAEAILAGDKTFEFRRALFRSPEVTTIVLYASSPTCKVVGEFTIDRVLTLALDDLWNTTRNGGASARLFFEDYYEGRPPAPPLQVKQTRRFRPPLSPQKDLGITPPPQSFCYLEA